MRSTRIRPGEGHENGVAEQAHYRLKSAIGQALVLRGSRDFSDVAAYEQWVRGVVERSHNRHVAEALGRERSCLRALPSTAVPNYTTVWPTVRRWSTIQVSERTYSVPSRLIGEKVEARLHSNTVGVYYRGQLVETMPRLRGARTARIDYRHVIWSLVRKPGAFARYRFREELFPRLVFRQAYDALRRWSGERADAEYVKILHLAASTRESEVAEALAATLARGERFDYAAVKQIVRPEKPVVPVLKLPRPDLGVYDALLAGGQS
jgi:Mu transposase-like protein